MQHRFLINELLLGSGSLCLLLEGGVHRPARGGALPCGAVRRPHGPSELSSCALNLRTSESSLLLHIFCDAERLAQTLSGGSEGFGSQGAARSKSTRYNISTRVSSGLSGPPARHHGPRLARRLREDHGHTHIYTYVYIYI